MSAHPLRAVCGSDGSGTSSATDPVVTLRELRRVSANQLDGRSEPEALTQQGKVRVSRLFAKARERSCVR